MKKFLQILLLVVVFSLPMVCFAATSTETITPNPLQKIGTGIYGESVPDMTLPEYIGAVIRAFLGMLGIALVGIIVYAGYLYMTAGDDSTQIEKAKLWVVRGIVGLIITLSAYAITDFVITRLIVGQNAAQTTTGAATGASVGGSFN